MEIETRTGFQVFGFSIWEGMERNEKLMRDARYASVDTVTKALRDLLLDGRKYSLRFMFSKPFRLRKIDTHSTALVGVEFLVASGEEAKVGEFVSRETSEQWFAENNSQWLYAADGRLDVPNRFILHRMFPRPLCPIGQPPDSLFKETQLWEEHRADFEHEDFHYYRRVQ